MERYYGNRSLELLARRENRHTYRQKATHIQSLSQLKEVDFVRYTFFVGHFLSVLYRCTERTRADQEEQKDTGGTILFL